MKCTGRWFCFVLAPCEDGCSLNQNCPKMQRAVGRAAVKGIPVQVSDLTHSPSCLLHPRSSKLSMSEIPEISLGWSKFGAEKDSFPMVYVIVPKPVQGWEERSDWWRQGLCFSHSHNCPALGNGHFIDLLRWQISAGSWMLMNMNHFYFITVDWVPSTIRRHLAKSRYGI